MKNYQLFKPISIIAALLFLVSCGDFDNKADGPVMVKVNFQLSLSDKSPQKLKSQGGSILTSVVYAVPDTVFYENETTSVQVFDRALLNTADNTVSLTVPLATPIKLVQENYNQNFSLSEISTLQGTYAAKGISASFSLTSDQAQQNVTLYFGKFSTAAITKEVLPGLECPFGGIAVETGIDENRNGVLDTLEVDNTEYVCNGADGASGYSALVSVTDELAGTNCPSGGKKIEAGLDTNSNAILDTTEITSTSYLCTDGPSVIETIPPTATVLLNNGDTSVVGSYVMMSLSAQDNSALTSVYISESPTVPVSTSAGWYPLMVNVEFNEQVRWTLSPGTGVKTIYVWFKDIFGNVSAVASDSITVSSIPADDFTDDFTLATAINPNSMTTGNLEVILDIDVFKITIPSDGYLLLTLENPYEFFGLLGNSPNNQCNNNNNDCQNNYFNRWSNWFFVNAGTYYIEVQQDFRGMGMTGTGSYTIVSEFMPLSSDIHGNTPATATLINPVSSTTGTFHPGDVDYFQVNLTANGYLILTTTGGMFFGSIFDVNNAWMDDFYSDWGTQSYLLNAGTYFIELSSNDYYSLGSYVLDSNFVIPGQDDHGDTTATATLISQNSVTTGSIEYPGDVDYFQIDVTADGFLDFFEDTYGSLEMNIEIYDVSGYYMSWGNISYGGTFNTFVTAGTYYVMIQDCCNRSGAYNLNVSHSIPVDDHGDSPATATLVSPNSATPGNYDFPSDYDYFQINIPGPGFLDISDDSYNLNSYANVFDSTYFQLASGYIDYGSVLSVDVTMDSYYVEVYDCCSNMGPYNMGVSYVADDHGNSVGTATAVAKPSITAGNIYTNNDTDYFSVNVLAAGVLDISDDVNQLSCLYADVYLADVTGDIYVMGGNINGMSLSGSVSAGIHNIHVFDQCGFTGNYNLNVN